MKRTNILFSLLILCLLAGSIYSQPKFTINLTGGYSAPLGDFKQPLDTVPEGFPYMMKSGINFGIDGKLAIGKKGNIRVVFGANYNMFKNSGTTVVGQFNPKINIFVISLGGEYAFSPSKSKINPFIGLDFTANFFSGSFDLPGDPHTNMKSETRIGIQPGAGIDFALSKNVGAVLGLKYHIVNLIGAGADNESQIAANEIDLGDKPHTLADGTTSKAKTVSYIQVYAGVSLYIGAPKRTMKNK